MTPDVLPPPGWNLAIPNSLALPSSSNDFTMALETSTYENFDPPSITAAAVRVIPASHFYIKSTQPKM